MLTIKPNVVAGILAGLVVTPKTVPAGGIAHGTVTLVQPVPKPTIVSIATNHNVAPGTTHNVSVVASAVTFKYASLTVPA